MLLLFAKGERVFMKGKPWVLHSIVFKLKELNKKKRLEMVELWFRRAFVPPLASPATLEAQQLIPRCFYSTSVK